MKLKILLYLTVVALTCSSGALAASHMDTIGKFYYQPDLIYNHTRCKRVSALLASRLSAHYTCNNFDPSHRFGKSCFSADGPRVAVFDSLGACEQRLNSKAHAK